ncbi:cytochrome c oxidase assembly protein [Streptacidiphilus anmyonensis]|uniref:cytochrome c oxidase assembly protein n=1 Tax=Streptacidiphilus anmyonensis TaxID=405782 RepID=UPI001364C927|nr:cytochrome c oxidase assembly protein [Streptacidiphilus anmyonensis]
MATDWQVEPAVLAISTAAAAWYLISAFRLARGGGTWSPARMLAFFGGLGLWITVCCSGLGVYERVLFTDRAVQAVLLLMLVPLLLALGAPVSLMVRSASPWTASRLEAALSGRLSRILMFPLVSTVLLIAPPWLFYFTPWYALSLTTAVWNAAFHVGFVGFGLAYFWPRLQVDPVPRRYHPLIGVVITVAEVIFDAALGCVLVFGGHVLLPHYWSSLHRPWGWTPAVDQKWGGAVLWGLGDIAGVPFMAALIVRVLKEEKDRTREVDEELDRQEQQRGSAPAGTSQGSGTESAEEDPRPWWETDARLAHRYAGTPPES